MSQTEPADLGQLWHLIERDSTQTRQAVMRELDSLKARLSEFVTKDQFDAERRLLEQRIEKAEQALQSLERQERSRSQKARDFVYKGVIPALSLIVAIYAIYVGSR